MEDQEKLLVEFFKNQIVNVRYYYHGHSEEYSGTLEQQTSKFQRLLATFGQVGWEFVED